MFLGLVFFHVSVCKTSKTPFLINENGKSFALFQKKSGVIPKCPAASARTIASAHRNGRGKTQHSQPLDLISYSVMNGT
jgi:hypothetical protein